MYTHIGNGVILKNKNIIGVFDIKTIQASKNNKRIQYELQDKKITEKSSKQKTLDIKSVVVWEKEKNHFVEEISPIAVTTLKKRLEKGIF